MALVYSLSSLEAPEEAIIHLDVRSFTGSLRSDKSASPLDCLDSEKKSQTNKMVQERERGRESGVGVELDKILHDRVMPPVFM